MLTPEQKNILHKSRGEPYILIVEDESNSRLLLETYLGDEGYSVKSARSGEEALKIVDEDKPSVIILDIILPGMNGYEVCKILKHSVTTSFIPVILVTALRGNEERIQGLDAGADDFISKPFNRIELLTRIKSLLRIKSLHEALEQKIAELEVAKSKLRKLAVTDGLTNLFNYRAFRNQLRLEISRSKRFNLPLSLLIMDLDHFKIYNDQFGHPSGDRVLKKFSDILRKNIREIDYLARYGGEEFVLILPGTEKKYGGLVAEKLRRLIEHTRFPNEDKLPTGRITMSVGVASYPQDAQEEESLIRLTDQALYQAKRNGRNRTVVL